MSERKIVQKKLYDYPSLLSKLIDSIVNMNLNVYRLLINTDSHLRRLIIAGFANSPMALTFRDYLNSGDINISYIVLQTTLFV
jgi:hypothetical protein